MSRAVPPCSGGRRADDSLRGAGGPRSGNLFYFFFHFSFHRVLRSVCGGVEGEPGQGGDTMGAGAHGGLKG